MEEIIKLIIENRQTIIQYVFTFLAYFLVFLFRSKVNNTKENLRVSFKETDKKLRKDVQRELDESKTKYAEAIEKISSLQNDVVRLERTLRVLIGYEETTSLNPGKEKDA